MLAELTRQREQTAGNRLMALSLLIAGLDDASAGQLMDLAAALEDGPVLAEALRYLGKRPKLKSAPLLLAKTESPDVKVRAAALDTLAELRSAEAAEVVRVRLTDLDGGVRRAAASAAGQLGLQAATESLLKLALDLDPAVRRASLDALRRLRDPRVVPLAVLALPDPQTQLAALQCIRELGGPAQLTAVVDVATRSPSAEILPLAVRLLTEWGSADPARRGEMERLVAEVQGANGMLVHWQVAGPLEPKTASSVIEQLEASQRPEPTTGPWRTVIATGTEARLSLDHSRDPGSGHLWLAATEIHLLEPTPSQFLAASNGTLRIWLNGQVVYQRQEAGAFRPDSDRFEVTLPSGPNRLLIQVGVNKGAAELQVRFRRKSPTAERERLAQAALARAGNIEHGRQLFFDGTKSQCIKCHRLREQGERIGPDLTGIGKRFSRVYIIESILEPSRTIAPSYETHVVALKDGRVLTGTRIAEDEANLTLGDNQGQKHVLAKANIEARQTQPLSIMPDGLEKQWTLEEFIDLIAFLVNQK